MSQKTIQRNKEKIFKTVSRLAKIMSNAFSNCVVTGNVDLGEHFLVEVNARFSFALLLPSIYWIFLELYLRM